MPLGRYAVEINGIGDEILGWINEEDEARMPEAIQHFGLAYFLQPDTKMLEKAAIFLGKTESQQRAMFNKLKFNEAMAMIITAAAMARLSGRLVQMADNFQFSIVGKGYRAAARSVAESVAGREPTLQREIQRILETFR